jgi:hypothetical protein
MDEYGQVADGRTRIVNGCLMLLPQRIVLRTRHLIKFSFGLCPHQPLRSLDSHAPTRLGKSDRVRVR